MAYLTKNKNLATNLTEVLFNLNSRQQTLINNVDRCLKGKITARQLQTYLVAYKRSSNYKLILKKLVA